MEDRDMTMEEYVQYETEKALKNSKVCNWETATYGKSKYVEDVHYLRFFKTEFPAIIYDDALTSELEFSSEPTVSPHYVKEVDLKIEISFTKSDDEDYTIIYDNDLFSYKIIYVNDLKSDTDNDDDIINIEQSSGDITIEPLRNVISIDGVKKSIDERALHKREYDTRVNERQMQKTEDKVDSSKALDASLVDTESSGTALKEQDTSSRSGNDAHANDADIRPIYDEEPMAEVQTTAGINVFDIGQQHTEQPEFNNDESSELGFLVTINERSSSKLVPKVVPQAEKTATSRQELELLFHHHITMLRIHKDGDGDASFQLKSDSLPHAHAQTTKTFYKHQDSRIMKAQELKTKTSAQTLIYKIFLQRYQVYQGRLLASFQDDAKYEHVGQDTRSQGGKDDQDGRIKI
ncbi:hypothetical protein Tco_1419305 [Tanacetum coccineum]